MNRRGVSLLQDRVSRLAPMNLVFLPRLLVFELCSPAASEIPRNDAVTCQDCIKK